MIRRWISEVPSKILQASKPLHVLLGSLPTDD
jgi:hypothetical protein